MTDKRDYLQSLAKSRVQHAGLKALSFRALAEEASIKSSSVHYYFPEKADLAEALIDNYSEAMMKDLEDISNRANWNLRKKISAFIDIFDSVAKDDAVCLCGMLAAEYNNLSDKNCSQLKEFFKDVEKWLADVFMVHKEELATQVKPLQLARSIIAGLEGALLVDRVASKNQCLAAQRALILSLIKKN